MPVFTWLKQPLIPALAALGRAMIPPRCLACGEIVLYDHALCPACWPEMAFIAPPFCACCGQAFPHAMAEDALCPLCIATPPLFTQARAALHYSDASRTLATRFKYADQTHCAPAFAAWMARSGAECLEGAERIVPVPLHRRRLLSRRYNQAALLARELSLLTAIPALPDALERTRHTQPQAGLSRKARLGNVEGAFRVRPRRRPSVEGKRLVLVDDVITTGATVNSCAAALLKAGAAEIRVLALARRSLESY